MTFHDLSGVYLKLARAEHHIKGFCEQLNAFRSQAPPPFDIRHEKRQQANKVVEYTIYAVVREMPPKELALPVGDAVQNIRAALDHLVYELSSKTARRSGKTAFPIFTNECAFKVNGLPRIKGIRGSERTLIENVQPFAASSQPSDDPLEILRKLSNLDKHRLLVPMLAATSDRDSWVASTNATIRWTFFQRRPVVDGDKIVSFLATPEDPSDEMYVHPESGLEVRLGDTGIKDFETDSVSLLEMLHHHVRQDVIAWWFEYGLMPKTLVERAHQD